ncbi:hypothetical protein ACJRO7_020914 [Eucalyptus globulus]|uniref:Uncharacterized protein n=1 Tax=Eucalyptus globulus TaxID=34317 RepID=A0ABD3KUS8_EUCGL
MPRKTSGVSRRAWNLLRLALLWARKGGGCSSCSLAFQIWYRERELSFDKTLVVHVKMHCPGPMRFPLRHIPCINPHVDFEPEFDEDDRLCYGYEAVRQSFLENGGEEGTHFDEKQAEDGRVEIEEDRGIDTRAEEFIAKFYEQTKLQRQISYLQYNEMLNQSAS